MGCLPHLLKYDSEWRFTRMIARAIKFCKSIGFEVEEYPIVLTDTLGAGIYACAEGGRIYIARQCFQHGTKWVAAALIEEFIHLRYGHDDDTREMQTFLLTKLVSLGEELCGEPL